MATVECGQASHPRALLARRMARPWFNARIQSSPNKKTKKLTFETFRATAAPIDVCEYHMYLIEIKKVEYELGNQIITINYSNIKKEKKRQ